MTLFDVSLVVGILVIIALLVWSRVQQQSVRETLQEIRDIIKDFKEKA